jgi:hypothetical protein
VSALPYQLKRSTSECTSISTEKGRSIEAATSHQGY